MFSDNLKNLRKAKGLSQEELAIRLSVVRQTVSKWENGLSVPDSELLIKIAEELDTTVSVLLGENVITDEQSELKAIAEKLEVINRQLAEKNEKSRKTRKAVFIALCVCVIGFLLFSFAEFLLRLQFFDEVNSSVGIIGGADGPTSILISNGALKPMRFIIGIALLVLSITGICKNRKKS